jgi:uncharacterized protein YjeT (DUF2065 family)
MPNPPAAAADFSKLRRVSIVVVIAFLPVVAPSRRCRLIRHFAELPISGLRLAGRTCLARKFKELALRGGAPPGGDIHIRSPFLGGRFGSKGLSAGRQILGILTARLVGRPVKHTDDGAVVSRVVTDGASYQVGFDADGDATISAAF